MRHATHPGIDRRLCRRQCLRLSLGALAFTSTALPEIVRAQSKLTLRRVGIFSLLGDSVRIVARETQEALFKDVGMDAVALEVVGRVLQGSQPQAELRHYRAPAEVDVQDQLRIGLAAARRAELPAWVTDAVREVALSHVLLVTSSTGVMEFRTALNEVVGNDNVTGIGFVVRGAGRTKSLQTGAVSTGYLAPFVQLRLTLIDLAGPRVVHSTSLIEGYIVGASAAESPDPWRFISRQEKALALDTLMRRVVNRGMQEVLARL